jgi:hypothetical protein
MIISPALLIRPAQRGDDYTLTKLSVLDSQAPVERPALIGEVDGAPVAAIGLRDRRVVSDPFQPSARVSGALRAAAFLRHAITALPVRRG